MLMIYGILIHASLPLVLMFFLWKSIKSPAYRKRILERFGFIRIRPKPGGVWIHCVSVGETKAAIPLVKKLLALKPEVEITVTCTTPTGSHEIQSAFGQSVHHCYVPLDIPYFVGRFLDRIQPQLAIMVETEVWPFTLLACRRRKIKTLLVNGRLSESSTQGYLRFPRFFKTIFACFDLVAAQYSSDAERFKRLGVSENNLAITGSVKFDLIPDKSIAKLAVTFKSAFGNAPLFIAASTHNGEEEAAIAAFRTIRKSLSTAKMIVVPRHPERFESVYGLLSETGFKIIKRTEQQSAAQKHQNLEHFDIMLGDTMGELLMMFCAADIAFVGGSLVSIGGHNILEAAVFGKPTLVGPNYFNFSDVFDEMINEGGCFLVENAEQLGNKACQLLTDPDYYQTAANSAIRVMNRNRGSLAKLTQTVLQTIE